MKKVLDMHGDALSPGASTWTNVDCGWARGCTPQGAAQMIQNQE